MYKLFTDKTEVFECNIKIDGASLQNSQARLIIESEHVNLLFKGTINEHGKCTIPIKKLKGLLSEDLKGEIKLEVIAEDTYFVPWKSEFSVEAAKKITVEVKSQDAQVLLENAPKVQITGIKQEEKVQPKQDVISDAIKEHVVKLVKLLIREDISLENISYRKDRVNTIIATYMRVKEVSTTHAKELVDGILKKLQ